MARSIAERSDVIPLLADVFRRHGYEGTSISLLTEATGLGKGSLYHFFPGGKEEMAAAVLADVDAWFTLHVFEPLKTTEDAAAAVRSMFAAVDRYFAGGGRLCISGIFALSGVRDRFAATVNGYFAAWIDALAGTLVRAGHPRPAARALAEDAVLGIQGALVLARALDDTEAFKRALARLEKRLLLVG